jgi:hypothetical protein
MKHIWVRYLEEEKKRKYERMCPCNDNKVYICMNCQTVVSIFKTWGLKEVMKYGVALCGVECDEAIIKDVMDA